MKADITSREIYITYYIYEYNMHKYMVIFWLGFMSHQQQLYGDFPALLV